MTSERNRKNVTQNATKQEIGAALKLIGLLYEHGEIRVYVLLTDTQRNYQDKAEKRTSHGRYLHLADDTGLEVTVHGEEPVSGVPERYGQDT